MRVRELLVRISTKFESAGMDKADKATRTLTDDAGKAGKAVDGLGRDLDDASKAAARNAVQTSKAASALDRIKAKAGAAADKLRAATADVGGLSGVIGKVGAGIATAGAVVGLGSVAAAVAFVGDETARLDALAKGAQKSGLGFEGFQRLSHVATLSGANIDNVAKGVGFLNVELEKIGRGATTGPVVEALQELGLESKALMGVAPEEQLALIADAMAKVPAEADRARIAFKLMSEDGKQLVPLFNSGGEAIRGMSAAVGRVFTREELAAAEAYQDALANLKKSIASLAGSAAVALAPLLTNIANAIDKWVNSNRGVIDDVIPRIQRGIERLYAAVQRQDLTGLFERITKAIGFTIDNFDLLVGLFAGAKLLTAMQGVTAAATNMGLAFAASLGPIGAIAAAVAALIPVALRAGEALGDVLSKQHAVATAPRGGGTDLAAGGTVAPELQAKAAKQSEALLAAEAKTRELQEQGVSGFRLSEARRREAEARIKLRETQSQIEGVVKAAKDAEAKAKATADAAEAKAKADAEADAAEFGQFDADVAAIRSQLGLKDGETATGRKAKRLDKAIEILAAGGSLADASKAIESKGGAGKAAPKAAAEQAAEATNILDVLGLRGPDSLLENRPAPQTLTIYVAPTIKMVETMTVTVTGVSGPQDADTLRKVGEATKDAIVTTVADVQNVVAEMFGLQAKRLTEARAGGRSPRGVP